MYGHTSCYMPKCYMIKLNFLIMEYAWNIFTTKLTFLWHAASPPQTHKANGKRNKNGKKLLLLTYTVWGIGQNAALYDCCNYQDH